MSDRQAHRRRHRRLRQRDDLHSCASSVSRSPAIAPGFFSSVCSRSPALRYIWLAVVKFHQYEKAIQSAFRDVADGLAARGTYDQQIQALERDTAAQQRRLDLSTMRYRQGVDRYLGVLTAQQDLYSAQQSLIVVRTQRLANLVALYRALGGGWIERTGAAPRAADAPA
jgi:multidrug efflux system outer membrane protein